MLSTSGMANGRSREWRGTNLFGLNRVKTDKVGAIESFSVGNNLPFKQREENDIDDRGKIYRL